jgi:hypothetical protein
VTSSSNENRCHRYTIINTNFSRHLVYLINNTRSIRSNSNTLGLRVIPNTSSNSIQTRKSTRPP